MSFEQFLKAMQQATLVAAGRVKQAKLGAPVRSYCFLASPWYACQIRTIRLAKGAPFIFTEKLRQELVTKEITLFETTDLKKFGPPESLKILETKNVEVKLNGYRVDDPFGKKVREVELTVFFSVSPKIVLEYIEHAIEKSFTLPKLHFFSFLFSSFVVMRNLFTHDEEFLLVDIGGEVTDISLVKKANLVHAVSYPLGKNFVLRRLASALGKTMPEVRSLIALYLQGGLDASAKSTLEPQLASAKTEWLSAFQKSLFSITNELSLPEKVLITADMELADWFREVIETEEFSQYVLTEKKFNAILVGGSLLYDFCNLADNVERNPFLMLESVFAIRSTNQTKS